MSITAVEDLDALHDFHTVEAASADADFVALPADPVEELVPLLTGEPRAGELTLLRLAREDGVPVGTLTLSFPQLDNLQAASLEVHVHPAHRRRGHGRALLTAGLDEVAARGRSRVFVETPWGPDESDGPAFPLLRQVGARQVLDDYRRLLDLAEHPQPEPPAPPAGYRVVQWVDRAPDHVVDGAAYLLGRMTLDAPMGEMDYEQEKWDAARLRASEQLTVDRGRTRLATCVVHEASGAVAGMTEIGVNRSRPEVAHQWDTIVDPDHRGSRLGLLLKLWNHRQLADQVPRVRWVNTWNAASNTFMIAVNEQLGYRPAERWSEWQIDL